MLTFGTILVFLLFTLLLLVLVRLFFLLVRACMRVFIGKGAFSQLRPRAVVLAGGLTAVLFSDTVNTVIQEPLAFLMYSFNSFARAIGRLLEISSDFDEEILLQTLSNELQVMAPDLSGSAQDIIYAISFSSVAAAIAVFLLFAGAFSGGDDTSLVLRVKDWYAQLEDPSRRQLALGATVVAGGYLSLAAIIAIPWLQSFEQDDPTVETELRQRLLASSGTRDEFERSWPPEILQDDPIEVVREPLKTAMIPKDQLSTDGQLVQAQVLKKLLELSLYVDGIDQEYNIFRQSWITVRSRAWDQRERLIQLSLEAYDRYGDTELSDRERELFLDDLVSWHRSELGRINQELRNFQSVVLWQAEGWRRWASEMRDELNRGAAAAQDIFVWAPSLGSETRLINQLLGSSELGQAPTPRDVSGLGIFGFFADWLVKTRSFPLALISGMVGFGLFGSVLSRALAQRTSTTVAGEVPGTTMDVLLVGVSAAVIIFLASQGGLAVFSSGELRPNAHILFLACFVGAAYGDRVWETARDRLLQSLQKAREGTEEQPRPKPSDKDPKDHP